MVDAPKATRLSKAAREFNVGISTIVEYLHKKGFDIDPNPNSKVTAEAYELLLKEYSSDLNVKKESDKLVQKEIARKQEAISLEKEKDEVVVKPEVEKAPAEKPVEKAKPEPAKVEKTVKEVEAKKSQTKTDPGEESKKESEPVKDKSGMKVNVVGKIDLDSIKTPKKCAETKKEEKKSEPKPEAKEETVTEDKATKAEKVKAEPKEEQASRILRISYRVTVESWTASTASCLLFPATTYS